MNEVECFYVLAGACFSRSLYFLTHLVGSVLDEGIRSVSAYLPKQVKLQMALEHVKEEMEEALTQEANVGKKTVIWKVRAYWGFRRLACLKNKNFSH